MGGGRFTATDWDAFSTTRVAGKATHAVFTSRGMKDSLDPKKILLRESRDSVDNPNSTPIIVGLDVTGSMGMIADNIARDGLKTLFTEIYGRRPVSDPHIMFMGIGDAAMHDTAPLQVSQFEADIRIADQLTDLFLEHGGGGNSCESYTIPWHFAAMKTSVDSVTKRGKKGYLFTVGDEEPPEVVYAREFEKVYGVGQWSDLSSQQLLEMVSRTYNVFHLMVEEGSHMRHSRDRVVDKWGKLLGQRAIPLADHTKLAEVIVSTIQVTEGTDRDTVVKSWSGTTSLVVAKAVGGLVATGGAPSTSVVEF
jgi:hypothetical protein